MGIVFNVHLCTNQPAHCMLTTLLSLPISLPLPKPQVQIPVTPLVLTFEGLSLLCNVGQSRHTLSLPEMFFAARGKVMEMKEHSRSRGLPAKLPEALL
jgi:hypothetical protein